MEIIVISFLVLVQSIFGIGLLLFGTPTFILLGYSYAETLSILLPNSILISLMQTIFTKKKNSKFIKDFNIFCIPVLIFSIFLILNNDYRINFNILISLIILLIFSLSLIRNFIIFNSFSTKIFLIIIGIVHGVSNLGGSLLSFLAVKLNENDRYSSRFFISYGYLTMASVQYLVLIILKENIFNLIKLNYLILTFIIYFLIQKVFKKIKTNIYNKIIYLFAFFYGFYIFLKSIIS